MTRILAWLLLFAIAAVWVQTHRLSVLQVEAARTEAALAAAQADAERRAREATTSIVDVLFDADAEYQRGKFDAQAMADRVAADLRSGALRVRREWAACETGRLADSAAAARELGDALERRNALAGAVVRVGAECDAKERALIDAYNGVRQTINEARP